MATESLPQDNLDTPLSEWLPTGPIDHEVEQ